MRNFIFFFLIFLYSACTAQSFTFVFLNSRKDKPELPKEELDKLMDGHLKNIERLAKEGKLIVSGPFEGGGGIFIMNTPSVDQAHEWLSTDPGIKANRWKLEVLVYTPRVGSACSVTEPYEMVTYSFIRFIPNIHKDNVKGYDELYMEHDDYIKQASRSLNTIAEGKFSFREGSILILDGEVDQEIVENDPGLRNRILLLETKKLWVAKGSFCE